MIQNVKMQGAALAVGTMVLSGCTTLEDIRLSSEQNSGLCPNVFALDDAARMIDFRGDPSVDTVAWSAEIKDVRTSCRYVADRPIRASVEIDFAVGRGPAATESSKDVTYFVAVTRKNRALIEKAEYAVPVQIRGDIATVSFTEEIGDIIIPRLNDDISGANFEIAVGFALTRDQVIFNRSGESLKFPNL